MFLLAVNASQNNSNKGLKQITHVQGLLVQLDRVHGIYRELATRESKQKTLSIFIMSVQKVTI